MNVHAMSDAAPRLLRRREVEERVGLSFTTIWRLMQEGKFPRPVHPTPHRSRWVESGINEWINEMATHDDAKAGPKGPERAPKRPPRAAAKARPLRYKPGPVRAPCGRKRAKS